MYEFVCMSMYVFYAMYTMYLMYACMFARLHVDVCMYACIKCMYVM